MLALLLLAGAAAPAGDIWLPEAPGAATSESSPNLESLSNRLLSLTVSMDGSGAELRDVRTGQTLSILPPDLAFGAEAAGWKPAFTLGFRGTPGAPSAGARANGREIGFTGAYGDYALTWSFELEDGANYVRERLKVTRAAGSPVQGGPAPDSFVGVLRIARSGQAGAEGPYARNGEVPGSPWVRGDIFAGVEYPTSVERSGTDGHVTGVERKVTLRPGESTTYTAVLGVAAPGQVRRGFLRYVERERAHPYRPFLHYNSWYDLSDTDPFGEYNPKECVDRINAFGQELTVKRGVKLSSFLFDDGWDDYDSVWNFSKFFPDGFAPLKAAAEKYGAEPGVWLSPWGGYGHPREVRLAAGKAAGMEEDAQGYALSGPKYFERFKQVTLDFVKKYGVNQFKFDGTGSPDKHYPGSAFTSDFDAAISLIAQLRAAQPNLFVNLTTGTWPSPFWLRYVDSTWRGGEDHAFAGVGTWRQKWMTYRDGDTYRGVVAKGPLYPLNSLMLHGLIYAQYADHLSDDPGDDFNADAWAYFATGTQLQELYISPKLLTKRNWDELADAAKWAAENARTLVDTHWIGGDPMKGEVYGHAAWNGGDGVIELRNPSDQPQTFELAPAALLELPAGATGVFEARSPKGSPANAFAGAYPVGVARSITLAPFQIVVLQGPLRQVAVAEAAKRRRR